MPTKKKTYPEYYMDFKEFILHKPEVSPWLKHIEKKEKKKL